MKSHFVVLASLLFLFTSFKDAKKELRYDGIYYSIEPGRFRTVTILRFYPDGELVTQTFMAMSSFSISEFDASYTNKINEEPIEYSLVEGKISFSDPWKAVNYRYEGYANSKKMLLDVAEVDSDGSLIKSEEKEFTFLKAKGLNANMVREKGD